MLVLLLLAAVALWQRLSSNDRRTRLNKRKEQLVTDIREGILDMSREGESAEPPPAGRPAGSCGLSAFGASAMSNLYDLSDVPATDRNCRALARGLMGVPRAVLARSGGGRRMAAALDELNQLAAM